MAGGEQERGTQLEVVAPTVPARVHEQLDTLDGLAAGWLLRFGPEERLRVVMARH